ncbi:protein FAR1-RELATED SEQUENCE 5-like [Arachis duranensis]|uniref:Protein FAR1-RELATED SEQUENCE 5-like n=1 Tax=Arachis duranensis TaxID=130453 RepID=A0A6P4BV90_ARADU|nr:protein FAR1-RELATED SEQUENCE 5-like [Arachis duranensis]
MLRFTKRDLYNYVHSQRIAKIADGDAAATISYLEGKTNANMMTVARYTKTMEDQLGSLLWADEQMTADYKLFGDVLAFDATYQSNKYKKPLVVFSGSNHHKQMTIFGFALLEDDKVRTYRWVLLNILDIMGDKTPSVVVTDGDKAMRAAIAEVLPSSRHRLCAWHLEKNCVMRVKDPQFRKVFKKVVYANFDVAEFEEYWKTAVESLGLMNNSWVKSTYEIRHSWATAYLRGTFCAGLLELVQRLDRVVKDYRNNEVTAQFFSQYYTPVLTTGLDKIELFASRIYIRTVFKEVRKQIKGVSSLLFVAKDSISMTSVHSLLPHILRDEVRGPKKIPSGLILRRWCKDAKEWPAIASDGMDGHSNRILRYGALCSALSVVAKLASEDVSDFAVAREAITSLAQRLHGRRENIREGQSGGR